MKRWAKSFALASGTVFLATAAAGAQMGNGMAPAGPQKALVRIVSPAEGDRLPGTGWDLELKIVVPERYAAQVPVTPGLTLPNSPYFKPGPNHDLPGLVVLDTGTSPKIGGPMKNLAGLFQVVGVDRNFAGDTVISVDWLVLKPLFSGVSMPCIRAFLVSGTAPATLSAYPTNQDIGRTIDGHTLLSNVAKVDVYAAGAPSGSQGQAPTVGVVKTKLGPVLATASGFTLYAFTVDPPNESKCYGACAALWPPLTVQGMPTAGPGVTGMLGITRRKDGQQQVTCNGRPLYTYRGDRQPGEVNGQGFRGVWYALTPSCSLVKSAPTGS